MKQCPNCKTVYTDDSLQFCLSDGANLIAVSDEPETVRMSYGGQPMRVDIPQNSTPTVFAAPPQIVQNQPAKKVFGLIVAGIVAVILILAIAGIAGFVYYKHIENKDAIVSASPTPASKTTVSPTTAPNDEIERLKEEKANLQKQLQDRQNQKPDLPANFSSPPKQTVTTARANSPRDGFLALRSEPNSETGYRIAQIPHGATITVLGCPRASNVGKMPGHWCQVVYNGQTGWAFDGFMTFSN